MCARIEAARPGQFFAGEAQSKFAAALVAARHAIGRLRGALERRRQVRALLRLDERLLADIGVTRERALQEAATPFWTGMPHDPMQ